MYAFDGTLGLLLYVHVFCCALAVLHICYSHVRLNAVFFRVRFFVCLHSIMLCIPPPNITRNRTNSPRDTVKIRRTHCDSIRVCLPFARCALVFALV